ncbi:hypothetical protein D9619_002606 [Psilocybe cf. subviscida]|uniref:C3H1-type domain-containing protein n=1 Tax=Psilocybe cf. subviscida TaxID=2480587 RepID=A0A8H5ETP5_9AGAR|nr:hypothetical protein D9619_002606 [Psilocybe cf. subviscida]
MPPPHQRRPFRCRGFDERGNPIGGGCYRRNKGIDCLFVHPDDPGWATASAGRAPPPGDRREPHENRWDSGSFDSRRPDTGYGSHPRQRTPPPDTPAPTWASSSTADSTKPSAWDQIKNDSTGASTSGGWGGGSSVWATGAGESSGGGWGAGAPSTWTTEASAWNSATPNAWQDSTTTTEKEKEADNCPNGTENQANAPGSTPWGAGGSDQQSQGASWGGGQSEFGAKPASWSTAADSNAMEVDNEQAKEWRPTPQVDMSFQNTHPDDKAKSPGPPPPSATTRKGPALPPIRTSVTPGPGSAQSPMSSMETSRHRYFSGLGLESAALSVLADGSKLRPSISGSSTPTTGSVRGLDTPSYDGPSGASRLYTDTVKALRNLVIAEVVYQRAAKVNDQQRNMQKANVYLNATTATRKRLEEVRTQWATKLSSLKSKRDEKLAILLSLPDLSAKLSTKIEGPMETQEAIMGYSQELQSWMEEIELHRRLLLEEKEIEERNSEKPVPVPMESQPAQRGESPEPEILLSQLLEKKSWTWKDTQYATSMVQTVIESTREAVFSRLYTKQPGLDQEATDVITAAINKEYEDELMPSFNFQDLYADEISQISSSINHMGEEVQEQAGDVANLMQKINNLEQELKSLQDEYAEMEGLVHQAEAQFPQLDIRAQKEVDDIQVLTSKLQTLHLKKELAAKAPPPLPPPQPLDINQISGLLKPGMADIINNHLNPIMEALVAQCRQNQTSLLSELELLIQPLNAETDRLLNFPS